MHAVIRAVGWGHTWQLGDLASARLERFVRIDTTWHDFVREGKGRREEAFNEAPYA